MPTCNDCQHWKAHATGGTGLCRARAPLPGNAPTGDYGAVWPKTKPTDHCGEHSPAPVIVKSDQAKHQPAEAAVAEAMTDANQRIARITNQQKRRSKR